MDEEQKTIDQKEYEARAREFISAVEELEIKFGIVQVPIIRYSKVGIIPDTDYVNKADIDALKQQQTNVESV